MKIAQIAPLYESVPPKLYGGTERVVAHLCDALVELGHDVTLFAAADARTKARLVAVRDEAIRLDADELKSDLAAHLVMLHAVRKSSSLFDVLHFHVDLLHFPMFQHCAQKTVTTLHGRQDIKDLAAAYDRWPSFGLVSVSNQQRRPVPQVNWLATIPHGIPLHQYDFSERASGGYLLFLGRISPEKRPDIAIHLARRAGIPLKIAAKIDSGDRAYFDTAIKPLFTQRPLIEFIGEVDEKQKSRLLGGALALLFPVHWPEPFGLVMIESMACGTPVIAWNHGSVPEVIEEGVSGYIVGSEHEALSAIEHIGALSRRAVRAAFERRFTALAMARAYLDVYARLLNQRPLRQVSSNAS